MTHHDMCDDYGRRCWRCRKVKPSSQVTTSGQCRVCNRVIAAIYRQTEAYRESSRRYEARPEVKERRKRYREQHKERLYQLHVAYRSTPRGRLICRIAEARSKLRRTDLTERRRASLEAVVREYTAALKRLDQREGNA